LAGSPEIDLRDLISSRRRSIKGLPSASTFSASLTFSTLASSASAGRPGKEGRDTKPAPKKEPDSPCFLGLDFDPRAHSACPDLNFEFLGLFVLLQKQAFLLMVANGHVILGPVAERDHIHGSGPISRGAHVNCPNLRHCYCIQARASHLASKSRSKAKGGGPAPAGC